MTGYTDHAREGWMELCAADEIDAEDVIRVERDSRSFAVYRSPEGTFHATDALCTHERADLTDGLVMGDLIECPKHNGRFNYKTGAATRAPAQQDLCVYPVRVDGGKLFIKLD